jgi:hypothetical protein
MEISSSAFSTSTWRLHLMKVKIMLLLLIVILTTSCSLKSTVDPQTKANSLAILEYHHSITIFQFELILSEFKKNNSFNSPEVVGMEKIYNSQNNLILPNYFKVRQEISLSSSKQDELIKLYKNCENYANLIIQNKNAMDLEEINMIIDLTEHIRSVNPYVDDDIFDKIDKLNSILENRITSVPN